eukprot:CAMPEP_0171518512 /NCGR_PEP_ID=MMETSP0959-20130129/5316_1 /TAXON_ID=87120 /ORGANISM="Aurantiochytrium limacinum, Strain ATCCMYA-1381" /LENGTH=133 /DNA_ID=CAMNT_0012057707 /DNA_START=116 /DNA_END=518 /DNA_ORIENTATION=-
MTSGNPSRQDGGGSRVHGDLLAHCRLGEEGRRGEDLERRTVLASADDAGQERGTNNLGAALKDGAGASGGGSGALDDLLNLTLRAGDGPEEEGAADDLSVEHGVPSYGSAKLQQSSQTIQSKATRSVLHRHGI